MCDECLWLDETDGYDPNLCAAQLDVVLGDLVGCRRRCEWLLCRYLADLADRGRFRELGGYSDLQHYARVRLRLGVKAARERVRIGRALRGLRRIEQAFVAGELSYSQVRELTRVATSEDESHWLELAGRVSMRELERRVVSKVGGKERTRDEPAEVHWRTPKTVELRMHLPAAVWAVLSRAIQGARQAAEGSLSDAEALEAVAKEALASLCKADSTDIADPRKAVVLYRCRDCERTELETGAGAVALPPEQAERLGCDSKVVDLETEGVSEARLGGPMPAAVRRAVLARDRGRCRVCGRRRYVDIHHLVPRSQGGAHSRANTLCACSQCHAAMHEGTLRAEGDAESGLRFFDDEGCELGRDAPIGVRQEVGTDCAHTSRGREQPSFLAPSAEGAQLLRAMGGRGGWMVDALVEATGLKVSAVSVALVELELSGRIQQHGFGVYAPLGAELTEQTPSQEAFGQSSRDGALPCPPSSGPCSPPAP